MTDPMRAAAAIAVHLNVPYGHVLTPADVAETLRHGQPPESASALANALLCSMFVECSPAEIGRAASGLGVPLAQVNRFYRTTLSDYPPCLAWEKLMEDVL